VPPQRPNSKVALNPFEEGFYLPPIPIKICDAQGIKIKIIGDKF
jgi:hypothetical protein